MPKRGQRKYWCLDCGETRSVHWSELNRRSQPYCYKCGSKQLEVVSRDGKAELKRRGTKRAELKDSQHGFVTGFRKRKRRGS